MQIIYIVLVIRLHTPCRIHKIRLCKIAYWGYYNIKEHKNKKTNKQLVFCKVYVIVRPLLHVSSIGLPVVKTVVRIMTGEMVLYALVWYVDAVIRYLHTKTKDITSRCIYKTFQGLGHWPEPDLGVRGSISGSVADGSGSAVPFRTFIRLRSASFFGQSKKSYTRAAATPPLIGAIQ